MKVFRYRARSRMGDVVQGIIQAEDERSAVERLRTRGYFTTFIREDVRASTKGPAGPGATYHPGGSAGPGRAGVRAVAGPKRATLGPGDLALIARQLGVMLGAGIPLGSGLRILAEQLERPGLRALFGEVREMVETGESLSDALRSFPGAFPRLFINMIEAGETSGQLEEVLKRLAIHYEKELDLRQKVKGALTYPLVVACFAVIVIGVLVVFVLPRFIRMFIDAGIPVPGLTMSVYHFGRAAGSHWYLGPAAIGLAAAAIARYSRSESGRAALDRAVLKLPVVGRIIQKVIVVRFARTFGSLVGGGVPMLQALDVLERVVGNAVVASAIRSVRDGVREGEGVAGPLAGTRVFPPMVTEMIAVGEETGALDDMLAKIADFYEGEVDRSTRSLTTLIEPVIIALIGIVVAFIAASVILPLFGMVNAI
ncbi:MAG TPA: type II secretion system F family protein [Firmicutes bacterium]|nr:type II secretion system F family protein [Bacillota bacterium]